MTTRTDAALVATAIFATGLMAGTVLISTVGPEPTTLTVTAAPVTQRVTLPPKVITRTVEVERASRSSVRETPRLRKTAESRDYTMTMDPALNARLWELIAACESSGNWQATGGSFSGGLQFLPSTWVAHGGREFAPTAAQASKSEQIAVANRLSSGGDWLKPWPVCGKRAATTLGMRFP